MKQVDALATSARGVTRLDRAPVVSSRFLLRATAVALQLGLLAALGCEAGIVRDVGIAPPVVDAVPDQTSDPSLSLSGTRAEETIVWLQLEGRAAAVRADDDGATGWRGSLTLDLGANRFVAFASDAAQASFSPRVGPFSVELVSAVQAPTLDPVLTPTSVPTQLLSGGKAAGTSLHLVRGGEAEREIVAESATTTWSYSLALVEGENDISIRARAPGASLPSPAAVANILLDSTAPSAPDLDNGDTTTGNDAVHVTGGRAADGNLCLRIDQEPDCVEVAPNDGGTSIALDVPLAYGDNFLCFSSLDALANASAEVCITVSRVDGPTITIVSPASGSAVWSASTALVADIVSDPSPLDAATVQLCVNGSACVSGSALGPPNRFGATLDLSGQSMGATLTLTVSAANTAGISSTSSITIVYNAGALVLSDNATPGHSRDVDAALAGTALHVVWSDECSQFAGCDVSPGNLPWDIFYRARTAAGWGAIELVSDGGGNIQNDGDSRSPAVAVDSTGNVHVVWVERGDLLGKGGDADVVHRVRPPGGSFGPTVVVDDSTGDESTPALAAGADGSVHLVRVRTAAADQDIYYSRWDASGGWSSALLVSDDPSDGLESVLPAVAVDADGAAHIVWQDDGDIAGGGTDRDIYYATVTGGSLGSIVLVTDNGQDNALASQSRAPAIAIDGSSVVIAWEESGNILSSGTDGDVFLRVYSTAQVPADTQYTLVSYDSSVASASVALGFSPSGEVVAAWSEGGSASADVVVSTAQSGYFFGATHVADTPAASSSPALAVDGSGYAHVLWEDLSTLAGFNDVTRPGTGDPDIDVLYAIAPTTP